VSTVDDSENAPIRVYRRIAPATAGQPGQILAKFRVSLPDRPGSLAGFASTIARSGGNISFFHYDRSLDSGRVAVEVQLADEPAVGTLLSSLRDHQYNPEPSPDVQDDVLVTAVESVLEVKVRLENAPGALASFALLLAEHDANVIYMLYDEDIDADAADIAVATEHPQEIDRLLQAVNEQGYHYRVVYRGSDEQAAANIIGLKMVEKFFLRLKKLLPSSGVDEIRSLVQSSRDLQQDLVQFATEAGNNLEAGDVFETVLTFASRSRSRTGVMFSAAEMKPVRLPGGMDLMGFRLPTSENFYLFRDSDELTMIDAGHGIYYPDIKRLLSSRGLDPSAVTRIFITHPDTDHAGSAGYFEREFGTAVFMHAGSADVMKHMNRAYGSSGSLLNLNKYYTRLSSRFTECLFPSRPRYFSDQPVRTFCSFRVIDAFSIGPLSFDVLESHGGHTPGLVFFLNRECGLLFTSDFLLNVKSLTAEDKEHLGIYRYLLTNPNRDSRVYKEETAALKEMMLSLDEELKKKGGATIFPGHGDYYPASALKEP
jgi:glyoxylase-like metal-dependent hydrolase (beta-lactamase superfamily II)/uncharacterized protein with ACT and thioredoxin-like domain